MADFLNFITETPTDPSDDALANDPINLVFYGNAPVQSVVNVLQDPNLDLWKPATLQGDVWTPQGGFLRFSTEMWAWLDNSRGGGWRGWKSADENLAVGPYLGGNRMHIRIYGANSPLEDPANAPPDPDLGYWSIAAVHREHWLPPWWHVIHGWHGARDFIEEWFAQAAGGQGSDVLSITPMPVGNAGWYQGYWHDGDAIYIRLA